MLEIEEKKISPTALPTYGLHAPVHPGTAPFCLTTHSTDDFEVILVRLTERWDWIIATVHVYDFFPTSISSTVSCLVPDLERGVMTCGFRLVSRPTVVGCSQGNSKTGREGKASSTLGYMSSMGYSPHVPAKHALHRFNEENKTKPGITCEVESTDEGLTTELQLDCLPVHEPADTGQ
ncbi:hypothetical protein EV401DRAFT_2119127 [Pisolithus croceorrhizus]|nr:hypothetical protein EV401DRAFT_2119127 [Pisolithus croceorrhizus]